MAILVKRWSKHRGVDETEGCGLCRVRDRKPETLKRGRGKRNRRKGKSEGEREEEEMEGREEGKAIRRK